MNMIMTSEHKKNGHDHKDGHEQKHTNRIMTSNKKKMIMTKNIKKVATRYT